MVRAERTDFFAVLKSAFDFLTAYTKGFPEPVIDFLMSFKKESGNSSDELDRN